MNRHTVSLKMSSKSDLYYVSYKTSAASGVNKAKAVKKAAASGAKPKKAVKKLDAKNLVLIKRKQ